MLLARLYWLLFIQIQILFCFNEPTSRLAYPFPVDSYINYCWQKVKSIPSKAGILHTF